MMLTPFIVYSTQRSGSTWMVDMLNSHPQIVAYSELFLQGGEGTPTWGGAKDLQFWNIYRKERIRGSGSVEERRVLADYLDGVYAPRTGKVAIGLKLMYGQAGAMPELFEELKRRRARIIHLVRSNYLDTVLSKEAAAQRDLFHARNLAEVPPAHVRVNTSELLHRLEWEEGRIEAAKRACALSGLPRLEVSYEVLAGERSRFVDVLEFLGVSPNPGLLSSSLQKLNRGSHRDLVENYGRVQQVLCGTRFERLLK